MSISSPVSSSPVMRGATYLLADILTCLLTSYVRLPIYNIYIYLFVLRTFSSRALRAGLAIVVSFNASS